MRGFTEAYGKISFFVFFNPFLTYLNYIDIFHTLFALEKYNNNFCAVHFTRLSIVLCLISDHKIAYPCLLTLNQTSVETYFA